MSSTPKKPKDVDRREFLKTSAKIGASVAFVASGCSTIQKGFRSLSSGSMDTYEYVVVGTGAGGGPVAANLAREGFSVCLLEAGGDYNKRNYSVPIFHAYSTEDPEMAWSYFVKHYSDQKKQLADSKYDAEMGGILYPRAGTVGGCTGHNAMIALYPDNKDWDDIADLTGDRSWNSSHMRDYFENLERNRYLHQTRRNRARQGFNGWLQTEQSSIKPLLRDLQLIEFVKEALRHGGATEETIAKMALDGEGLHLDPNDWSYVNQKKDGIFRIPKATNNGARNGTRELIADSLYRYKNLELRTYALATKVLFHAERKNEAIGVEYLEGKTLYEADMRADRTDPFTAVTKQVFATREVILAGGAFNSPQLLMLSGIGDPAQLEPQGIEVRVPLLGVGRNLQDRYEVGVVTELPHDLDVIKNCTFGESSDPCMDDYKKDPKEAIYGTNGVTLAMIEKSSPEKANPDLCIFGLPGFFRGYFRGWSKVAFQKNMFTWAILKGHTQNTSGSVTLRSPYAWKTPEINFRFFDDDNNAAAEADLDSVMYGVKRARAMRTKVISQNEKFPGKDVQTDDEIKQYIKREAWGHHASCSNKMGPASDEYAVVDNNFKVHKTERLRVVDASVFPKIPGLFIVVPIYMIAEKASDVIITDARNGVLSPRDAVKV